MTSRLAPAAVAGRTGLSIDTLRYYEREGLIGPIGRSSSGRRTYTEDDVFWIGLVTCLREAGLGISDLREFTTLLRRDDAGSDRVTFLKQHKLELEDRLRRIQAAVAVLTDKIAYYENLR